MTVAQRKPIAAGNWKMNLLRRDAEAFCQALAGEVTADSTAETVLFPSATLLTTVASELKGTGVGVGGQDLHPAEGGAHTGDLSGLQLADAGCGWVLCGHSERRQDQPTAPSRSPLTRHGTLPGRPSADVTAPREDRGRKD